MNNKRLAVAIITKNNIRTIEETVVSVQGLCDHILVVDSGSTDGTIEFCKSQGVEVAHRDWPGVADQKQFCIDACADYQWVLSLDSDESLDETLFEGVKSIVAENDSQYDGYSFNRKVWFMNGWLDNVFQPEFRMRLFRGGIAVALLKWRPSAQRERVAMTGSRCQVRWASLLAPVNMTLGLMPAI